MQFYVLDGPKAESPEDLRGGIDVYEEDGFQTGPAPHCPTCGRILGLLSWLSPYRIELETWGHEYGDIDRRGDDLVVSDRFVAMVEQCGIRGVGPFEPVEVIRITHRRKKPMETMPNYWKTAIVHSSTTVDQAASLYEWEDANKVCPTCLFDTLKRYNKVIIKRETWTGEDLFFPRGGVDMVVSEHFKSSFERYGLRNAIFIPSEQCGYDSYPWETQAKAEALAKASQ